MKAKVIATGEIVNVHLIKHYTCANLKVYAEIEAGRTWREDEIIIMSEEQQKKIDWEQRRFELIKQMLPQASVFANEALLESGDNSKNAWDASAIIACKFADAVIAKLKEGNL